MENLLAIYGLQTVSFVDEQGCNYWFVYSDKMIQDNIFIEFYEKEIEVDQPEQFAYETSVSVFSATPTSAFHFMLLFDDRPLVAPLIILAVIRDAMDLIEKSNRQNVFSLLKQASVGAISSARQFGFFDLEDRDAYIRERVAMIHRLILQGRARQN